MSVPEGKVLPLTETPRDETVSTLPHTEAAQTGDVFIQSTAPQATTIGLAAAVPLEQQATTGGLAGAAQVQSGALAVEEAQIKKAQYEAEHPTPKPTVIEKATEFATKTVPSSQIVNQASEFVTHTIPTAASVAYNSLANKVDSTIQSAVEHSQKAEGQGVLAQANEFLSQVVPQMPQGTRQTLSHLVGLDKEVDSATPTPDVAGGPGGFPQTPAFERRESEQTFGVNPLPASKGSDNPVNLAPGEEVPRVGTASVNDTVKLDEESYKAADDTSFGTGQIGISPLPASRTAENPVTLKPGEEVPKWQADSVDYQVKLDEDSYKAADSSNFGVGSVGINPFPASETAENPVTLKAGEPIPDHLKPGQVGTQSITSQVRLDEESYNKSDSSNLGVGVAAFTLPEVVTPDEERAKRGGSLIPGVEAYFRSSKTESHVPDAVQDSIKKSDWAPEATANSEAVETKKDVESELLKAVKDHQKPAAAMGVPPVVAQSIAEVNTSPEAAANPIAVEEKKDVEKQLLEKAHSRGSASTPVAAVPDVVRDSLAKAGAPAEAAASPEAVKAKEQVESALVAEIPKKSGNTNTASAVPEVVKDSLAKAHAEPEAAAGTPAVEKKLALEEDLLKNIDSHKDGLKHVDTKESSTLPANGSATAATTTASTAVNSASNSTNALNGTANGHANGNGTNYKTTSAASATSSRSPTGSISRRKSGDESAKSDSDKKKEKRSSKWFHKLTHPFSKSH